MARPRGHLHGHEHEPARVCRQQLAGTASGDRTLNPTPPNQTSFYRAFEDRYRGAREIIKDRLRAYARFTDPLLGLPRPAGLAPAALDLGCGRGEWLELLGEAGFAARGVDLDDGMLAACRERGL